jgi:hypothetical protein
MSLIMIKLCAGGTSSPLFLLRIATNFPPGAEAARKLAGSLAELIAPGSNLHARMMAR